MPKEQVEMVRPTPLSQDASPVSIRVVFGKGGNITVSLVCPHGCGGKLKEDFDSGRLICPRCGQVVLLKSVLQVLALGHSTGVIDEVFQEMGGLLSTLYEAQPPVSIPAAWGWCQEQDTVKEGAVASR